MQKIIVSLYQLFSLFIFQTFATLLFYIFPKKTNFKKNDISHKTNTRVFRITNQYFFKVRWKAQIAFWINKPVKTTSQL